MSDFDVAVVGGGVLGASIAYFLGGAPARVALMESGAAGGEGASRFSGGLVRAYDPDAALAELSLRGASTFLAWERLGMPGPSPMRHSGLVYITKPESRADAERAVARLGERGYAIESVAPRSLVDELSFARDGYGGAWLLERNAGYADVRQTVRQLVFGAEQRGVSVFEHTAVQRVERAAGHVRLDGPRGSVTADRVVVATGIHASRWFPDAALYGRTIPLMCVRSEGVVRRAVVDENSATYIRPVSANEFWCGCQHVRRIDGPSDAEEFGSAHQDDALSRLDALFGTSPSARSHRVLSGLVGWDGYSESLLPCVGFADPERRIYLAGGLSGRGFKFSLSLGASIARELVGESGLPGELTADLSDLPGPSAARQRLGQADQADKADKTDQTDQADQADQADRVGAASGDTSATPS